MGAEASPRRVLLVVLLVCVAAFAETVQFTILNPALPTLAEEFGLTDVQAGAISSAYALGIVLLQLPAGRVAARIDERLAVGGALVVIGLANVWFGLADTPWQMGAARFLAGAASTLVWAGGMAWASNIGPRSSQATRLGLVISAAVIGSLVGPVLGSLINLVGRPPVFFGIAVVCVLIAIPLWLLGEGHAPVEQDDRGLLQLLRRAWLALTIGFFVGALFSALGVMVPLTAVALGAAATVVGGAFIVGSLGQALLAPLVGRFTDRKGPMAVMSVALVVGAALTLALVAAPGPWGPVLLLALIIPVAGAVYTPSSVAVEGEANRMGLAAAIAFSAWNFTWAVGVALGAVAGPWLGGLTSDGAVYVLLAAVSLLLGVLAGRAARGWGSGVHRDSPTSE